MSKSEIAIVAVLCLTLARGARAVPTYNAASHGAGSPVDVFGSTTPLEEVRSTAESIGPASTGTGSGAFVGSSTTASGPGYLKDASAAELTWAGDGGNGVAVDASSGFRIDDIVITAPGGTPAGTQVYYAFSYTIAGEIDASVTSSIPSLWSAGSSVSFGFGDNNVYPCCGGTLGQVAVGVFDGVVSETTDTGVLAGFPLGVLTTVSGDTSHDIYGNDTRGVTFPATPLGVSFFLNTAAGVGKESNDVVSGTGAAYADFAKTFELSTTGPVVSFTDAGGNPLAGWTANSGDGCIHDNYYVCSPEPVRGEMFEVSIAALGFLARRRGARPGDAPAAG